METSQYESNDVDYIDYERIKNFKYKNTNVEVFIMVNCYYNGTTWICPNPYNTELCEYIDNWYNSSHLVKLRQIHMPEQVLQTVINDIKTNNNNDIILSDL